MIVRDEERFLPDCLSSLIGKVDEIIVVDTGSLDATAEIAAAAGARVCHFNWIDDFAAARNFALEKAASDWILYIDADERLHTSDNAPVATFLPAGDPAAFVRFTPRPGFTSYRELRLFRRDPRIRFSGRIHETIVPALDRICKDHDAYLRRTPVGLQHLGYEGNRLQKAARDIPLLRRSIEEEPGRLYCWYHLADSLNAIGRTDEAFEIVRKAVELARVNVSVRQAPNVSLIFQLTARMHIDRDLDPLPFIREGLSAYSQDYALHYLLAQAFIRTGDFKKALETIDGLLAIDSAELVDGQLAFDKRIFGEFSHQMAGTAAFRLGLFADAAAHFSAAVALSKNKDACQLSTEAVAKNPVDVSA